MDALLVVNTNASGASAAEDLARRLREPLGCAETWLTSDLDDLYAALAAADGRRVVLAGGDGTLHAAVNAPLALPDLALIPLGRANNVARALGVPTDPLEAVRLATRGATRAVDVLRVERDGQTLYCLEAVSAGLQADARSRYHGRNSADLVAGARALLSAIHGYRPYIATLFVDGKPAHDGPAAQVFLSNLPLLRLRLRGGPVGRSGRRPARGDRAGSRFAPRARVDPGRGPARAAPRARGREDRPRPRGAPRGRRAAGRRRRGPRRRRGERARGAGATPAGGAMRTTGPRFLIAFAAVALGIGLGRAVTTTYVPVLLERIKDAPALIGAVMLVNAIAGLLVPVATGLWSDRARTRLPFLIGGTAVTAGGLTAIALGQATTYLLLALAAALTYTGLNAALTAHRTVIAESIEDGRRPAATSAEEIAMLVGGMLALGAGGALIDSSPELLFAGVAVVLGLLLIPTALVLRPLRRPAPAAGDTEKPPSLRGLARDLNGGARLVLGAQVLWVLSYAALPAFFVLYAEKVLTLGAGPASAILAAFGLLTGAGMVVAGRTPPELVHRRLSLGAALLGGGLLAAAPAGSLAMAAVPFGAAAVGMGLVSGLGFPYFARFVPEGRSGSYSGLYFAVRGIASAIALPAAGGLIALTGSYRVLMVMAGVGLFALVPLGRAEALRRGALRRAPRPAPQRLGAVIPCIDADRLDVVLAGTLRHVDIVAIVDDGAPAAAAAAIDRAGDRPDVLVVRLDENAGKGEAVAAGAARLLAREPHLEAIVVLDADGQHPAAAIPSFAHAAADADVVIGDRRADHRAMPRVRRATNAISSALLSVLLRRRMLDSQCGMRLYRAEALERAPLPDGRYEAETVHLRRAIRAGLEVGWVPIPAIYDGAPSAFRPVRDTARVLGAILGIPRVRRPSPGFGRLWTARQAGIVAGTLLLAALTPLLGGLDHRLFTAINGLGAGPDWLYEALDPHTRNYILLCLAATVGALLMRRRVSGTILAVTLAAFWSNLLVQIVYLLYNRPRPEETLSDGDVLLVAERSWGHIASFPSGHLVVTTAIAVAAMSAVPALRGPLWGYVGLIALTRITFGAHFPLDVFAGLVFGAVVGRFCAAFAHEVGLLARPAALMPALPQPLLRRLRPSGAAPAP